MPDCRLNPLRALIASKDEINNDHRDRPVATYFAQRRNETGLRCSRLVLSRIHISVSSPFACYHLGQMRAETDRSQRKTKIVSANKAEWAHGSRGTAGGGSCCLTLRKIRHALVPPKPNELVIANSRVVAIASLRISLKRHASSTLRTFVVGVATWSLRARTVSPASRLPAAPRR